MSAAPGRRARSASAAALALAVAAALAPACRSARQPPATAPQPSPPSPSRDAPPPPAPPSAPVPLRAGLTYRELACTVSARPLRLRQLAMRASEPGLELRAVRNPTATTDARCAGRYGGAADIRRVTEWTQPGFDVLGAANGNFFHRLPDGTFRSNGMIWSRDGGAREGRLLAPVQPTTDPDFRGDHVFLADASGGHEIRIATGPCTPGACRVTIVPPPATPRAEYERFGRRTAALTERDFIAALRDAYPTLTVALQINHAYAAPGELRDAGLAPDGAAPSPLAPSFACTATRTWTCRPHPVTLLCAARGGTLSLLSAEETYYPDLPAGLRPGGPCGTECELLYILDGGGSTQIGYVDPSTHQFALQYAGHRDPQPAPGCAEYRPVEHYLAVGAARADTTRDD